MQSETIRILISATGTGGHIFPAIAIARAIQARVESDFGGKKVEIRFIGTGRDLEKKIIDQTGFPLEIIPISGLKGRGLKGIFNFVIRFPKALIMGWRLFRQFRPQLVIGVGGYGSFLPITLAYLSGIPTWIHEAELYPGTANWVLAHYCTKVSIAFEDTKFGNRSLEFTGHPIKSEIRNIKARSQANDQPPRRILVIGGSLGAAALDNAMLESGQALKLANVEIWHQSRPDAVAQVQQGYNELGISARVDSFIKDMAEAYSWSDVIVSRAGAGSVLEIGVANRPSILVPLPNSIKGHQVYNAQFLSNRGKAITVLQDRDFDRNFKMALQQILQPQNYFRMLEAPIEKRPLDAAERIAEGCINLLKISGKK